MNTDEQLDPSLTAFVRPENEYRGQKLAPYAVARKILFSQATVSEDRMPSSGLWLSIALLYLLTLTPEEASKQAFNRKVFREKALAWFDSTGGAPEDAVEVAEKIFSESEETKVEVAGEAGTDPKNA
jgi:hypothetical protein